MRGGRHVAFNGQVREERFHFRAAHVFGVALVMKQDKALDPVHVGFFGADGIVLEADHIAHLVEQFLAVFHRTFLS